MNTTVWGISRHKTKKGILVYLACKKCGTTKVPHKAAGLCNKCSDKFYNERRPERQKNAHSRLHKLQGAKKKIRDKK